MDLSCDSKDRRHGNETKHLIRHRSLTYTGRCKVSLFTIAEVWETCTLFCHGCLRQNLNYLFLYMANMSGVEYVPKHWKVLMTCWLNALTHWPLWDIAAMSKYNSQAHYTEYYLEHQLWNCSQKNARELYGWEVTLVLVTAWCRQATSHYRSQFRPDLWRHMASTS